jgi:hypothetical protein
VTARVAIDAALTAVQAAMAETADAAESGMEAEPAS